MSKLLVALIAASFATVAGALLALWLRYRSEKYFGADRTPPGRRS